MQLISVIVPVYNSEKYLHRCIDSIICQTYKNLEILLIDDGSTDSSPEIIDEYAQKDVRIKAIHKQNSGTGPTRQYGIEHCNGKYVAFVDNDDYIVPTMYEKMMNAVIENNADYCACQFNYQYSDGSLLYDNSKIDINILGVHNSIKFSHFLYNKSGYENGVVCSIWNKLFRKDLLIGIKSKNGRGEEEEVNDYVNRKNVKVVVIPDECYYWCENFSSVTHSGFKHTNFHFLEILEQRSKWFIEDHYMKNESMKLACNLYIEYYFYAKAANIPVPSNVTKIFRNCLRQLFNNNYCERKFYFRMIVFLFSKRIYKKYSGL